MNNTTAEDSTPVQAIEARRLLPGDVIVATYSSLEVLAVDTSAGVTRVKTCRDFDGARRSGFYPADARVTVAR